MNFRKLFPSERPDESVYVFARPYYLSFLPWLTLGGALIVVGVVFVILALTSFPELITNPLGYDIFIVLTSAYFLMLLPFLTVAFIDFYYDLHIVTDHRLVDINQKSLFVREVNELALEEVQDVSSQNTGILRSLFDFGDIVIETAGAERNKFVFNDVFHPREIASIILDLADQAKQRIEHGAGLPRPSGDTKAVIDNKIFNSTEPLEEMGAVVAKPAAATALDQPLPAAPPSPDAPPVDDLDIVIDQPPPKG